MSNISDPFDSAALQRFTGRSGAVATFFNSESRTDALGKLDGMTRLEREGFYAQWSEMVADGLRPGDKQYAAAM